MLKIGSGLQQFDLKFVRIKSVLAGLNSISTMIGVGYNSGQSLLGRIILVNGYMSVTKIGYSSGSTFSFSVIYRFGYNFGSGTVGSINLKKKTFSGRFTFDFGSGFQVGSLLNCSNAAVL